jgi:hypothetical protein
MCVCIYIYIYTHTHTYQREFEAACTFAPKVNPNGVRDPTPVKSRYRNATPRRVTEEHSQAKKEEEEMKECTFAPRYVYMSVSVCVCVCTWLCMCLSVEVYVHVEEHSQAKKEEEEMKECTFAPRCVSVCVSVYVYASVPSRHMQVALQYLSEPNMHTYIHTYTGSTRPHGTCK